MQKKTLIAGALVMVGALAACEGFLTDAGVQLDPNRPSVANIHQLFKGVQVTQFVVQTGDVARVSAMWNQQMAGIGRQQQDRDAYNVGEDDFSGDMSRLYSGGGLVDIRKMIELAGPDRTYAGIAKVWEALTIGTGASLWGDLPYSEAVSDATQPALDEQAAIYASIQTLLDQAIADLQAGAGVGPEERDLVYGGNRAKWIQAAYTLKARFYMHWVEAQNYGGAFGARAQTACAGSCVTKALAAAQNGISTEANDFRTHQSTTTGEQNLWWQFMNVARVGDIAAGQALVELMKSRGDPRLPEYFATVGGEYLGAPPATEAPASQLAPGGRGAADYGQPILTHAENLLIIAEAQYRLGATTAARTALNAARALNGIDPLPDAVVGAELFQEIALEKYIALFQNIEVWNDHKRLCMPALVPADGDELPGRLYYGSAERNANRNIPAPGEITERNDNDPEPCPLPDEGGGA